MKTAGHTSTNRERHVLGLNSGTSADGVDAALIAISGRGLRMRVTYLGYFAVPYPSRLRARLLDAMQDLALPAHALAELHALLGSCFADAARRAVDQLNRGRRPAVIGSHGQTISHQPKANPAVSWQLGDAARIAAAIGCPVVADFRSADVAAGGDGAPLVPWTDWILLRDARRHRAIQNIGGIANVTYLPAGGPPEQVIAFDTGPGNMMIDELVRIATRRRASYDRDGRRAARGRVNEGLLAAWMSHPFLRKRPPKSTGREAFGRTFVEQQLPKLRAASDDSNDWIATATALTARSIAMSYRRFLPSEGNRPRLDEVIVCGGGAANATMLTQLAVELVGTPVRTIDAVGIPAKAKEAVSFAILAAAYQDGVPANLPHVTGARRAVRLGALYAPGV